MIRGGNWRGSRLVIFFVTGILLAAVFVLAEGQEVSKPGFTWTLGQKEEGVPWWASRLAPPSESVLHGMLEVDRTGHWNFPYEDPAAWSLLAPLDDLRVFTWDEFWSKVEGEGVGCDRLVWGYPIVVVRRYLPLDKGRSQKLLWFVLTRVGKSEPVEVLLMARWVEKPNIMSHNSSEFSVGHEVEEGGNSDDVKFRKELEHILSLFRVTEVKCRVGGSQSGDKLVRRLKRLAEALDELSFPVNMNCAANRSSELQDGFEFRLVLSAASQLEMLGVLLWGENRDCGKVLKWYQEVTQALGDLRRAVETRGMAGCELVREDGLTFLEKRPPHPPLKECLIVLEDGQKQQPGGKYP